MQNRLTVTSDKHIHRCSFTAMGSDCEILFRSAPESQCKALARKCTLEITRLENKYSRFKPDSLLSRLNQRAGRTSSVDEETARLLNFAATAWQLSNGLFDITSGILATAWPIKGQRQLPDKSELLTLMNRVGWQKVAWDGQTLTLPEGMALDLGGIAKEYAVDRCVQLIQENNTVNALVNLGGDIGIATAQNQHTHWHVGIEHPDHEHTADSLIVSAGAVATSGQTRRYFVHENKRYGHIINPKTGWPVEHSPRSVTVQAGSSIEAGFMTTYASLCGSKAEDALQASGMRYWIYW